MFHISQRLLTADLLPLCRHLFCSFLIIRYHKAISGLGNVVKSGNLYRNGWACFFETFTMLILHGPDTSIDRPCHKRIPDLQGTVLNQNVRDCTFSFIHPRLQDNSLSISVGIGFQLHQFSFNQKDRKSTRLNSSHVAISYAVFCLKKKLSTISLQKLSLRISHSVRRTLSAISKEETITFRKPWKPSAWPLRKQTRHRYAAPAAHLY